MNENIEKLESAFNTIIFSGGEDRSIAPIRQAFEQLKEILNTIFPDNLCLNALYTLNTDKQFFGVRVSPVIDVVDAITIIASEDELMATKYEVEFDSKLFDIGFTGAELAAVTVYNIATCMTNSDIFNKIRHIVDGYSLNNDDIINIRDSVNYAQLVIFAIKDTMFKLSNIIFKDQYSDLEATSYIADNGLADALASAKDKLSKAAFGVGRDYRTEKPVVLGWLLTVFKNMRINSRIVKETLTDAKAFSGSKLEIKEIDKSITALDKINSTLFLGESADVDNSDDLNKFFEKKNLSRVNEISIFKSLKRNGLRGIENDLYEYSMRVKNCREADDAYLVMRGINSRLGILEDYLYNEQLPASEAAHWENVANQYRELRMILSKKKFNEKQYGLFFDYSALDKLDRPQEDY